MRSVLLVRTELHSTILRCEARSSAQHHSDPPSSAAEAEEKMKRWSAHAHTRGHLPGSSGKAMATRNSVDEPYAEKTGKGTIRAEENKCEVQKQVTSHSMRGQDRCSRGKGQEQEDTKAALASGSSTGL